MPVCSEKSLPDPTSPIVVAGLTLGWAWWDLAFYLSAFYSWNANGSALMLPSFVAGMAASGVALLLFACRPGKSAKLLWDRRTLALTALAPIGASALCIAAAPSALLPPALAGSMVNGTSVSVLIALWFSLASERGARSAIFDMSLGIALGIALDAVLLVAMKPLAVAVFASLLPLFSVLLLHFGIRKDPHAQALMDRPAIRPLTVGHGLRDELFGLSLTLLVGIVIAEIGFNFMNYRFSFAEAAAASDSLLSFSFLIARGIGAFVCFVAMGLLHVSAQRFFWVGTMLMSAAFAIMPFFEIAGISPLACNYVNMACFALVAIFEIAVFSEVAHARRVNPLGPVCFGMVFLTGVTDLGMCLGALLDALRLSPSVNSAITTAVGYAVVFGLFATVSAGLRYLDPATGAASGRRIQTEQEQRAEAARQKRREELVGAAGLTAREQQVLDHLLGEQTTRFAATSMGLSENTVKTHAQSIYKKLGVHGRQEVRALFELPADQLPDSASELFAPGEPPLGARDVQRPALDGVIAQLSRDFALTEREREVFALLARGYRNREIEKRLVISSATVHSHVTSIYAKMGLHSRSQLTDLVKQTRDAEGQAQTQAPKA